MTPPWPRRRARTRRAPRPRSRRPIGSPTARFYAFATALAKPEKDYKAEAGPRRAERQARIDALRGHTIVDEDTVLPGVPLWWRTLDPAHADARDRPSRLRGPGRGLGPAPPLREERAVRPAVVSLRLGLAALHGLGVGGRVPIRPAPGRIPGADGQRAPHLALGARLRDGAALRRVPRAVRALVAPPGVVGGDGGDAARPRPLRHRGERRGPAPALRAAAPGGLGSSGGATRGGGRLPGGPRGRARGRDA